MYGKTRTKARHALTIASACPDVYARFPSFLQERLMFLLDGLDPEPDVEDRFE
jgi:hypothetical protein